MKRASTLAFIAVLLSATFLAGRAPALSTTQPEPVTKPSVKLPIRDLKTLSHQERLTLPDTVKVMLGARAVTLGELRLIHAALAASHIHVKSLTLARIPSLSGGNHAVTTEYKINQNPGGVRPSFSPSPSPGAIHLAPLKMATPTPQPATLPLVGAGAKYPTDYQQFCRSVPATLCLFYPAGVAWYGQDGNNFWTIDYLVTDASVCSQEGGFIGSESGWGQLNGDGCIYEYPATQSVQFVPPNAGFKTSGWCNPSMFKVQVDSPHGVVVVSDQGAHNQSSEEFCFLQVILNH